MNGIAKDGEYILGVNYLSSRDSINMWENWDAGIIDDDFKKLSSYGIKALRMFLIWPVFQPLKAMWANSRLYELRMMPDEQPLPDTEAGQAGVSEKPCQHFGELCHIADKYGIKLIVGLLTGHMSFRFYAPAAFEGRNFLSDPTLIKWEIKFIKYFVKRFKNEKAILAWDLGNECNGYGGVDRDQSYVWMHAITSAIRLSDTSHPIVSGFDDGQSLGDGAFNIRDVGELTDVLTTHPYHIFKKSISHDPIDTIRPCINPTVLNTIYGDLGNKPCFVEEIGSIGYVNCSEKTEAQFAKASLFSAWSHNCNGYFWWCAFDQGGLNYAPYDWNNYGSDYGLFRADGSAKPIANIMKDFGDFLNDFPYARIPRHITEAVCILSREQTDCEIVANATFILAKQAGFDISFAYAEDKLPESNLYLLPSVTSGKPIFYRRLNELLEKVKNGATLFLSTDQLFRSIPELTGITVSSREKTDCQTVVFGNESYRFTDSWLTHTENISDTCSVLAYNEYGEPFFVCNEYGNGKIYYMPYKLELMLAETNNPFAKGKPEYYRFYDLLAPKNTRVAKSTDSLILTTEHIINEEKRLVTAINYNNCQAEINLQLSPEWEIGKVYYGSENLLPNAAYVLEVIKKKL